MYQVSMSLALGALLYKVQAIRLKGWPIVVTPENPGSHGSFSRMQTADTLI